MPKINIDHGVFITFSNGEEISLTSSQYSDLVQEITCSICRMCPKNILDIDVAKPKQIKSRQSRTKTNKEEK